MGHSVPQVGMIAAAALAATIVVALAGRRQLYLLGLPCMLVIAAFVAPADLFSFLAASGPLCLAYLVLVGLVRRRVHRRARTVEAP